MFTINLLLPIILFYSCVSSKKYTALQGRAEQARIDNLALHEHLRSLEDTLRKVENRLGVADNANETALGVLSLTRDQMDAQQKRMQQMQSVIEQQRRATEGLKMKIANALVGFKASELTVALKNGRVYVSMQEALLFRSASAKVCPRGKDALAKVASILTTNPDIKIDIEGHTDNLPIHTSQFDDNWSLSTARATSIAHILIDEYGVSPLKLVASGRAYYDPIAINNTANGRAQNRRTEIILEPKYDELIQLLSPTVYK
jgi:chemotaxis protein MotB